MGQDHLEVVAKDVLRDQGSITSAAGSLIPIAEIDDSSMAIPKDKRL
jgi:hypothetical protein